MLHANGKFSCLCSVCNEQTRAEVFANLSAFTNKVEGLNDDLYHGEERSFKWLLENLVYSDENKLKGCVVNFPDSVIFSGGRPKFICKNEKDGSLSHLKNP